MYPRQPRWRIRVEWVERCVCRLQQSYRVPRPRHESDISCIRRGHLTIVPCRCPPPSRRLRGWRGCVRRRSQWLVRINTIGGPLDASGAAGCPEITAMLCLCTGITRPAKGPAHFLMATGNERLLRSSAYVCGKSDERLVARMTAALTSGLKRGCRILAFELLPTRLLTKPDGCSGGPCWVVFDAS